MAEGAELLLDRFFVRGIRAQFQVTAKRCCSFRDATEMQQRHATLLVLVGGFRIGSQQQVQQAESLAGSLSREIDVAEVIEHPHHDRSAIHRSHHGVVESLDPGQGTTAIEIDQHTAMEGVDEGRVVAVVILDDKVAWQGDSVHGLGQTTRHFHVDKGEGNRDTQTGIQNVVQAAVLCRIVVLVVAPKPEFSEQIGIGGFDEIAAIGEVIGTSGDFEGMAIQQVEILSWIEARVLDPCNFERGDIQPDVGRFATEKIEQLLR